MEYAIDGQGERISAFDADKNEQYFCPICGQPVIPRQGDIKVWHFAHVSACSDSWHYEMTDWHRDWQNRFPEECREVVIEKDGIKHRADILIHGYVIEFQHSQISLAEFEERNRFYTNAGYKVIWVFDEIEAFRVNRIRTSDDEHYQWSYASKALSHFAPQRNKQIAVILQLTNFVDEESFPLLVKMDWSTVGCRLFIAEYDFCPDLFSETGLRDVMLDKDARFKAFLQDHSPYKIKKERDPSNMRPDVLICEKTNRPHCGECHVCEHRFLKEYGIDEATGRAFVTFYCEYPKTSYNLPF